MFNCGVFFFKHLHFCFLIDNDADGEEGQGYLDKLKKIAHACGMTKMLVTKHLKKSGGSVSQQIKEMKKLLKEMGMEGRPSMDKAERVKLLRELKELSGGNNLILDDDDDSDDGDGAGRRGKYTRSTRSRTNKSDQPSKKKVLMMEESDDDEDSEDANEENEENSKTLAALADLADSD